MASSCSESNKPSTLKLDTASLRFKTGAVPVPECGSIYDTDNRWFVEYALGIAARDEASLRNMFTENDNTVFEIDSDGTIREISKDPDICCLVEALKLNLNHLADLPTAPSNTGPAHQISNNGQGPDIPMADGDDDPIPQSPDIGKGPTIPGQWANEEDANFAREFEKRHGKMLTDVLHTLETFGPQMSDLLYSKTIEFYGLQHLLDNFKPSAVIGKDVNCETGPGYFGALKYDRLLAQHVKQYPFLKVPHDEPVHTKYGTFTDFNILTSHEQAFARRLDKVTIDGYFRRKCDILGHLFDWNEYFRSTRLEKEPFVKAFRRTMLAMDGQSKWPLMVLETFRRVWLSQAYAEKEAQEETSIWLAWLLIVEPVPARYQKGGDREVNEALVKWLFRTPDDFENAMPTNKISGRVKEKHFEAVDPLATGSSNAADPSYNDSYGYVGGGAVDQWPEQHADVDDSGNAKTTGDLEMPN